MSGQYAFRHALYQEVIYARLTPAQRVRLHRQIGARIERAYGERAGDIAAELSRHFVQGRDFERAVRYLRAAGNNARRRSACQEAVANFDQALEVLQQLPSSREREEQAIDLRFDLRRALVPLGDRARILTLLQEAESLAIGLKDAHRLGWLSASMAQFYVYLCQYERAIALGQRAFNAAVVSGDIGTQVAANFYAGASHYFLGQHRQAVDCLQWNAAMLQDDFQYASLGIPGFPYSSAQSFSAWFVSELGDFKAAIAWAAEGLRNAEVIEDAFSLGVALAAAGVVHLGQGNLPASIAVLERGMHLCQEVDLPLLFPRLASALGAAYTLARRSAEGLAWQEQAVERADAMQILHFHTLLLIHLGESYRFADHLDDAARLALRALDLARKREEQGYEARSLLLLGDIEAHCNPPDVERAATSYQQALALANALDMRPLQAHCHRSLGALYRTTGQGERWRAELTRAIEMYDNMEMTFWSRQAQALRVETPQ